MRKLLVGCLALLLLSGCSKGLSQSATYEYIDESDGIRYEEVVTIKGVQDKEADWLDSYTSELTLTFSDEETYNSYINELRADSEGYRACPGGNEGQNCSKYITYDYSIEGMVFKSKEEINYKDARKNKEGVSSDDYYSEDEYYSFDKTVEGLVEDGFTKK